MAVAVDGCANARAWTTPRFATAPCATALDGMLSTDGGGPFTCGDAVTRPLTEGEAATYGRVFAPIVRTMFPVASRCPTRGPKRSRVAQNAYGAGPGLPSPKTVPLRQPHDGPRGAQPT